MAEILVVEDDEDVLTLVCHRLKAGGRTIHKANDGKLGLSMAVEIRPDLVVLDWMLPSLSGVEICKQISNHPDLGATKVLMLTARAEDNDVDQAFDFGADGYMTKPFNPRELRARVDAMLTRP